MPSEKAVKSARTALGLGLDAFARLLAPYLPYATEEVWSWMHEGEGSVHHAAWPKAETYDAAAAAVSPELLTHAGEALAALRGIKSKAKVSMKTPILSVQLGVPSRMNLGQVLELHLGWIAHAGWDISLDPDTEAAWKKYIPQGAEKGEPGTPVATPVFDGVRPETPK